MLVYRVFPYLPSAADGEPGHPGYLNPGQGTGRLDNAQDYLCWYFAAEPSGAVGELFGDLGRWSEAMLLFPALPGSRRALGVYELADDTPLLNLDDARSLLDRGLRPTQVIARNRPVTQAWALRVFQEQRDGHRTWAGVRWWSFQRPQWTIVGIWQQAGMSAPTCVRVESLDLSHVVVVDAARALAKPLR